MISARLAVFAPQPLTTLMRALFDIEVGFDSRVGAIPLIIVALYQSFSGLNRPELGSGPLFP
jgi:hypothetical protein